MLVTTVIGGVNVNAEGEEHDAPAITRTTTTRMITAEIVALCYAYTQDAGVDDMAELRRLKRLTYWQPGSRRKKPGPLYNVFQRSNIITDEAY